MKKQNKQHSVHCTSRSFRPQLTFRVVNPKGLQLDLALYGKVE